jgi:YgiT-type zinc finger domain-containing protein
MNCVICRHGTTQPALTTVTLERGRTTVLFREVPTLVCENCGEAYHDAAVSTALNAQAEAAFQSGAELDVRRFSAAA